MKALGAAARATDDEAPEETSEDSEDAGEAPAAAMRYSRRNNLAVTYVATDGKIYLRNAGFWNSLNIDRTPFAPAVDVDEIVVALYPPAVSAQRSLLAREFVGFSAGLSAAIRYMRLTCGRTRQR
jgi:5-methylcytosine-specific restriction enzyme B